jgi:hypothetical protein
MTSEPSSSAAPLTTTTITPRRIVLSRSANGVWRSVTGDRRGRSERAVTTVVVPRGASQRAIAEAVAHARSLGTFVGVSPSPRRGGAPRIVMFVFDPEQAVR